VCRILDVAYEGAYSAWLDETHGASFELVRHFLASIFDSDMFSVPGEWQKVAAGLLARCSRWAFSPLPTFVQSST